MCLLLLVVHFRASLFNTGPIAEELLLVLNMALFNSEISWRFRPHVGHIPGVLPGAIEYRASVDLVNGTFHDIVLEYRENDGAASIQVCLRCSSFIVVVVVAADMFAKVVQV